MALSGPPAALEVVVVDEAGSAAALATTGSGSVAFVSTSESFAAFALSSNPPIGSSPLSQGFTNGVIKATPV